MLQSHSQTIVSSVGPGFRLLVQEITRWIVCLFAGRTPVQCIHTPRTLASVLMHRNLKWILVNNLKTSVQSVENSWGWFGYGTEIRMLYCAWHSRFAT